MMGLVNTTKINIARWWTQPTFSWLRQQYLLGTRWCQCEWKRSCISFLQTLAKCFGTFGSSISNHVWFRWCMEIEGVAFPVTYIPSYTIPRPFSREPYGEIRTEKKGLIDALEKQGSLTKFWDLLSREFVPKTSVIFCGLKGQVPVKLLNLNGRLTTERNNPVVGTYQNWQWWVLCLLSVSRSSFCATGLYQIPNAHHGFRVGPGVITANSKTTTNPRKSVNSNILETGGRFWIETWARQCVYIYSCKLPPHSEFGS